jgi:sugar/nucleoside kinase (ribokinase family)
MAFEQKKIVCVGMMTCDVYYYGLDPDTLNLANSATTRVVTAGGGDATNVCIDIAHVGYDALLVGLLCNDFFGDGLMKVTTNAGVDVSNIIRKDDVETTTTVIMYRSDAKDASDRHCVRNEGGNAKIAREDITDDMLMGADHLHYGSFGPLKSLDGAGGADLLKRAKELGLSTSLDVKGLGRDFSKLEVMLPYVDLFMPNLEEVADLTGLTDLQEIKAFFKSRGVGTMCIKMAEKGVFISDGERDVILSTLADPNQIVDVMGAGDAFCAGFISAFLQGLSLEECGTYASLASKHCLACQGASTWVVSKDDLYQQMKAILAK